ncbi:MAG: FAD:protein FMN transferase [Candidatus Rokuibacteriota bacterium]|nr:MAG: FAD:protein FMN transferase [Candidatus Rokubacteria bacterium]
MSVHRFSAMGCEIAVGGARPAERRRVEVLFREREQRFTRFSPLSELNRVNASEARVVRISGELESMLRRALRWAGRTEGLVDPTLGEAVVNAGYDREFELLEPREADPDAPVPGRWRSLRISPGWLCRPVGVQLDLNGVVKGQTVDDALELIGGEGFVSAGGDLAVRGGLEVALPGGGAARVIDSGLATSGSAKRRWLRGGDVQHHLIDPRGGAPSDSPWLEVTVSAATCLEADVAAKVSFLLGLGGPAWLDTRGLAGRFLFPSGKTLSNLHWRRSLEDRLAAA